MPPVLTKNGEALEVDISTCRGSDFHDAKLKIKAIPGSNFDWDKKVWRLPAEPHVAERALVTLRPEADESLIEWVRDSLIKQAEELASPLPEDTDNLLIPWARKRMPWQPAVVNDEDFNGLLDYQRVMTDVMTTNKNIINASDMGTGKTLIAISAVEEYKLRHPADPVPSLVICPNSVKGSWERELNRWLENPNYVVVDGATLAKRQSQIDSGIADNAWVIINWEQIRVKEKIKIIKRRNGQETRKKVIVLKEPMLEEAPWLSVVADEIHRAKNRKALQAKGLYRVHGSLNFGLTGTPLMNSPDELWSPLHWLFPKEYTSFWNFYGKYVEYYENPYFGGRIVTGVLNPDALRFELKDRLIRVTSAQTRSLPGIRRIYFPIKLNPKQQKLYDEAETALWLQVMKEAEEGDKSAQKFAQAALQGGNVYRIHGGATRVLRLQQIVETPATLDGDDDSAILDECEERIMDSRPEPWLVFCKFKATVGCLVRRLETKHKLKVRAYTGDVKDTKIRTQIEDDFQRGDIDVIVGTIDAMKEGITLTRGHLQYWCTRSWVPDQNEQGEDRQADRLGQQRKTIVYIPQAEDTVAVDKVEPANKLKEKIVRTVISKDKIEETRK